MQHKNVLFQLSVVTMLALAVSAASAAPRLKVFVCAATACESQTSSRDGFVDAVIAEGSDSVRDIQHAIYDKSGLSGVMRLVRVRSQADMIVQVVGREEVNGACVVRARGIFKDHDFELKGSSTHQWKISAAQIADQLADWISANRSRLQ